MTPAMSGWRWPRQLERRLRGMRRLWFWYRWEFVNCVGMTVFGSLNLVSGVAHGLEADWWLAGSGALLLTVGGLGLIRMYRRLPGEYEKD